MSRWLVLIRRVTSVLAVQGARLVLPGTVCIHSSLLIGFGSIKTPFLKLNIGHFTVVPSAQAGCGGMGHTEQTHSTLFLLLHPEGRGKGGICISAKLGQVLLHWLAHLAVEKQ